MTVTPQEIGNLLCFGFHGTTAPAYLLEWLRDGKVGGVILFARNVENPHQLMTLTDTLHRASPHPILISIDQEGGTVARLRDHFIESPSAMALSNTDTPAFAQTAYHILASEMHAWGINWDYAPVVDITYNRDNPTVGTRSFGTTPERVARFACEAVQGLQSAQVAACAKHFPGLGNTTIDTHVALPTLDATLEHLLAVDLHPYRAVIDVGIASIMTTHTQFLALDSQYPATLSPTIVHRLLRQELGYEGVVTTDCMEMKAIADNYGAGESAVLAVLAGIDIVLFSHTRAMQEQAFEALTQAVKSGRIPVERVREANARRAKMLEKYAIAPRLEADRQQPMTVTAKSDRHQASMVEIAQHGISLVKGLPPEMDFNEQVAFIEFASLLESEVMEQGGSTGIKTALDNASVHPQYMALKPSGEETRLDEALEMAKRAKITIIATRNAHLIPQQAARARQLAEVAHTVVHVCLRNPYDADLLDASTVICTLGDSQPSLVALLVALQGNAPIQEGLRFDQL